MIRWSGHGQGLQDTDPGRAGLPGRLHTQILRARRDPRRLQSAAERAPHHRGAERPPEEIEGSFKVAEEGVVPSLVFEVVSATYKDSRDKDYTTAHRDKFANVHPLLVNGRNKGLSRTQTESHALSNGPQKEQLTDAQ